LKPNSNPPVEAMLAKKYVEKSGMLGNIGLIRCWTIGDVAAGMREAVDKPVRPAS
jgi:hypothetical protein